MLRRAAREHNFDLAEAVIIGDSDTDLLAGQTAGTATILLGANGAGAQSTPMLWPRTLVPLSAASFKPGENADHGT